jgi:hypothetical protein
LIKDSNNLSQDDYNLIVNSGFSLKTLFTTNEIASLSGSVLNAFKSSIITMTFDRESARIILNKLFDVSNVGELDLNTIKNLIIGLDTKALNLLSSSQIKSNLDLIINSVDLMDSYFKEILISRYFSTNFVAEDILRIIKLGKRDLTDLITLDRIKQTNPQITLKDIELLKLPNDAVTPYIVYKIDLLLFIFC